MARANIGKFQGNVCKNGDNRFCQRRSEEDSGAWKIFDDVWNSVACRRHEGSRREIDSSTDYWYNTGSSPRSV